MTLDWGRVNIISWGNHSQTFPLIVTIQNTPNLQRPFLPELNAPFSVRHKSPKISKNLPQLRSQDLTVDQVSCKRRHSCSPGVWSRIVITLPVTRMPIISYIHCKNLGGSCTCKLGEHLWNNWCHFRVSLMLCQIAWILHNYTQTRKRKKVRTNSMRYDG